MSEVARINVVVGIDNKQFMNGMKGVGSRLKDVGGRMQKFGGSLTKRLTLPMVAAGAGALKWAQSMGESADRILDLEQVTGMSTGAIQKWQHVSKMAGTDTEAMTRASQRLNREMTAIQEGTGKASEALGELGVSANKLSDMTADERLETLVGSLQAVEDPAERARLGTDLFGREWENVAPIVGLGADELEKLNEQGEKYGRSKEDLEKANEFRERMEELKAELGFTATELGTQLMPLFTRMAEVIKDQLVPFITDLVEKIKDIYNWYMELSPAWQDVIKYALIFLAVLGPLISVIGTLTKVVGIFNIVLAMNPIGLVIIAIVALIAIGVLLWKNWDKIVAKVKEMWGRVKEAFENLKTAVSERIQTMIQTVKDKFNEMKDFIKGFPAQALQWGKDIINKLIDGLKSKIGDLKSLAKDALNSLNPFAKSSPSLVENVQRGLGIITDEYAKIGNVGIEPVAHIAGEPRTQEISGVIRVEGANSHGEFMGSVDILIEQLGDSRVARKVNQVIGRNNADANRARGAMA